MLRLSRWDETEIVRYASTMLERVTGSEHSDDLSSGQYARSVGRGSVQQDLIERPREGLR
jgi:hypothetical protein